LREDFRAAGRFADFFEDLAAGRFADFFEDLAALLFALLAPPLLDARFFAAAFRDAVLAAAFFELFFEAALLAAALLGAAFFTAAFFAGLALAAGFFLAGFRRSGSARSTLLTTDPNARPTRVATLSRPEGGGGVGVEAAGSAGALIGSEGGVEMSSVSAPHSSRSSLILFSSSIRISSLSVGTQFFSV
jgi:hypothetical protein